METNMPQARVGAAAKKKNADLGKEYLGTSIYISCSFPVLYSCYFFLYPDGWTHASL